MTPVCARTLSAVAAVLSAAEPLSIPMRVRHILDSTQAQPVRGERGGDDEQGRDREERLSSDDHRPVKELDAAQFRQETPRDPQFEDPGDA